MNHFQRGDAVFPRLCQCRIQLLASLVASRKSLFEIDDPYS